MRTLDCRTSGRSIPAELVWAPFFSLLIFLGATAALGQGAGYVGDETCAECHGDVAGAFSLSAHGRADLEAWGEAQSCESCHGPGASHVQDGDPASIRTFDQLTAEAVTSACTNCHNGTEMAFWQGSTHEVEDTSCTSCHGVHQDWTEDRALNNRNATEGCLECHADQRKKMLQRSGHPLKSGQMGCTDCHSPHGSAIGGAVDAVSVNDKCWECHAETRGPFLWEHAPVRENCLTCHDAHGSNQTKMLTVAAPRLCQSCHLFGHHQTVPGQPTQVWNMNRSCVNCHPRIHGSNHPSGVIFMR